MSFKTFWETGSLQLKSAAFMENQRYFLLTRNPVTDDSVTYINSENRALILHQIANLEQRNLARLMSGAPRVRNLTELVHKLARARHGN